MTVGAMVRLATDRLGRAGVPEPRREAQLLIAWLLGTDRGGLVARASDPVPPSSSERLQGLLERRAAREPFQYLAGEQEFRGLVFRVDRRVLVPRPETEEVVQAVLGLGLPTGASVADLGTGSGCIAVSLAVERPDLKVHALDVSNDALEVARENARRLGALDRVLFARADLADPPPDWMGLMHAVVSNPPYVGEAEWEDLAPEVRDHEPRAALVSGPTGLEAYVALAPAARSLLRPGGTLVVELGYRSEEGARAAVVDAGLEIREVLPDPRGIPRVLLARLGGGEFS